jgi:hypothetical protein
MHQASPPNDHVPEKPIFPEMIFAKKQNKTKFT